jgi:hypothetical protein
VAYTVNKTSGAVLSVIADGTLDTTTNLTLIGKNYAGYGEVQNENFVKLLENFANSSAPSTPLAGQLWWDSTNTALKVYTGAAWVESGGTTSASSAPASPTEGDLWYDTTNDQLKAYNGSAWIVIGPSYSGGVISGAIVDTIVDNGSVTHTVVKMYVADVLVVIVSKDSVFTPNVAITGFATVSPGYNLSTNISGGKYTGTSTDSDALGGVAAANYLRSNANDTTSGTLGVLNDNGVTVGVDSDLSMSVSGNDVTIKNVTSNGNILLGINQGGSPATAITISGSTNAVTIAGDLTVSGTTTTLDTTNLLVEDPLIVVAKNVSGTPAFDAGIIVERGSSANTGFFWDETADEWAAVNTTETGSTAGNVTIDSYANMHCAVLTGLSTSAKYADLAENFTSDYAYDPGTVLQIGGQNEVTMCELDASEDVLGVVSSYPAYLMNSEEDGVSVAISGRVPVKISGPITKGDRLVSAGNGTARKASKEECTPWNVIGRALENDTDKEETHITMVMCIVKAV